MGINNIIDEVKQLRGNTVEIFGQQVLLEEEIDELDIDVIDVLESLKEHEMEKLALLDYNEEIDDYEEVFMDNKDEYLNNLLDQGAIEEKGLGNSFNWQAPVSNHFDFTQYENIDTGKNIVELKVHKYGDVRANYTNTVLLEFDNEYAFYEKLGENNKSLEYEGYQIDVDLLSDEKLVYEDDLHVYTTHETSFEDVQGDLDEHFDLEKQHETETDRALNKIKNLYEMER